MIGSLHARLYLGMAAVILVTGLAAGATAFRSAFDEAIELQDSVLLQIGALAVDNNFRIAPPIQRGVDAETRVVIEQLGGPNGVDAQLVRLPDDLPDGLQTKMRGANSWRILVQTRPDGSRVAISQSTDYRDEIARDSALRTILPLAALIPCLMMLVGIVIRYSFRPVSRLAAHLDAKKTDHLAKLPSDGMPEELRPFIASINRLLERIGAMFDQQRRFVADAAHELRTPITALSLQVDNLDRENLPPDISERLTALKAGIRRTAHLLEQLLALARLEGGQAPELEPTAFEDIAKEAVAEYLPRARARSIDLGFLRMEPVSVKADGTALAILVRNLIDNAVCHIPDGGCVDVALFCDGDRAVFRVEDSGPGIPEAAMSRVFEPFYRGGWSPGEGTGLGLSIVRRIVESSGGSILLENIVAGRTGLRAEVRIPAIGEKITASRFPSAEPAHIEGLGKLP